MSDTDIRELKDRIEKLESENRGLIEWQKQVGQLLPQIIDLVEKDGKDLKTLQNYSFINRIRLESLPYELADDAFERDIFKPEFMTIEETRKHISDDRMSISRFGDGEFGVILGTKRWNFQRESDLLAGKLKSVLEADDEGFLIGLNPNFYGSLNHLSEADADGVRVYMRADVRKAHAKLLKRGKRYANALLHSMNSDDDVRAIKMIWNDKDCVFVEGQYTRMGVGNDLFDNCRSIERILCPAENAVDRYDDIVSEVLKQNKDKLILLALGPTATALSYDLFKEGYWAVDIGHVDLVYEKYLRKYENLEEVKIPYKYCNMDEIGNGREIPDIDDKDYKEQIIAEIF